MVSPRGIEWFKLIVYDHGNKVNTVLAILSIIFGLAGLALIIYSQGFSHPPDRYIFLLWAIRRITDFFILRYLTRVVISLSPSAHFRDNIFESLIIALLSIDHIFFWVTGTNFFTGVVHIGSVELYFGALQLIFLFLLVNDIGKASFQLQGVKLNPAILLVCSFLILIGAGAFLLHLPEMTPGGRIAWVDAFFTSTSASCVTGLAVLDTGTGFTFKGQIIILVLIFLGGLNILTIATFIGSLYHRAGSLESVGLIKRFLDTDQTANLKEILRNVVLYAVVIQAFGSLAIFFVLGGDFAGGDTGQRIYFAVFHSISAFNNAGFSLLSDSLFDASVRFNYPLQLIIATLIVLGGLGFLVLQDIFSRDSRRARKLYPWKKLLVNTRLVLWVTLVLILLGTFLFFVFEYNNTLSNHSLAGKIVVSLFQSITTRTAGFNSIDTSLLLDPTILLFCLLMFIGASPGSTGGGIKTTTFAVAIKAAWTNLRGREHVEFFKRNISWVYVNKTNAVLVTTFSILVILTMLIVYFEPAFPVEALIFEMVSAYGTVGLSLGITPGLSDTGKYILMVAMFIGRIGSLTLGLAITRRVLYTRYRYPGEKLMIG